MQPYAFPYVGYFNLIHASTHFVFYDDVSYIKQGWINRNQILVGGVPHVFTLPVTDGSYQHAIRDVALTKFEHFRKKFLRTLRQTYGGAMYFDQGITFVTAVLTSGAETISELAQASISEATALMDLQSRVYKSSENFADSLGMNRTDRLIAIAKALDCQTYINPVGGAHLYQKSEFLEQGVELRFTEPQFNAYRQYKAPNFVPAMSIIDVLMNVSADEARSLCQQHTVY